jgi:ferric-dicitrate binding protein FerR (iron transport regulator)
MDPSRFDIDELMAKYFAGALSEKDHEDLEAWLNASPENREIFRALRDTWSERSPEPEMVNSEEMVDRIWSEGTRPFTSLDLVGRRRLLYRIAAIFFAFILAPLFYLLLKNSISFRQVDAGPVVERIYRNPSGKKARIVLPDSSVVWMNGGSVLRRGVHFNDTLRMVELSGEAFFEVHKDASRPFVVSSGALKTTALGTSFNVKAYPDQQLIKISLASGRIRVEDKDSDKMGIELRPGSQLVFNTKSQEFLTRKFDDEETTGWLEGKLVFRSADYDEFIGMISHWYGVNVVTVGDPPDKFRLTTVYNNESLENILRNITFGKSFTYELKGKDLTLRFGHKE